MLPLDREVAAVAQQPTAERVQALKRIIPCSTIKSILKHCGQARHCARLPKWFMVWFVIGMGLLFEAAAKAKLPPRRLSFTGALKILRCRLPECPRSRRGLQRWYQKLLAEIAEETLPPRRDRVNPRVIKCTMSKWAKKKPEHRHNPQPTKKFRESLEILR
jgi:hypothetical protein